MLNTFQSWTWYSKVAFLAKTDDFGHIFYKKNTRNLVKNNLFALNFETVERFSSQFNFDCLHFAKYRIIALG